MPALELRGRYLMREYWADSDLFLRLNADEREFYQGLWMLADDAGWMPRDVPAIAAALYRYEDRTTRERWVVERLARLRELGKITSHRCCLYLDVVVRYPRAGRKFEAHRIEHEKHSKRSKRNQTETNPSPVPSLPDSVPFSRAPEPAPEGAAGSGGLKARLGSFEDVLEVGRRAS